MTTGNDKNQASIIAQRLPEFVQTDNPTMVAFVQAYYEWLDGQAQQGYLRTPNALDGANDIDRTLDSFVSEFKKEYLLNFPEQLATNKEGNSVDARQLMKNIKEFYRNKGTEKTYEFLFRVLYDAAIDFYYPARDILRLSDGKWIQKKSIRCSNELGNKIFDARGKIIRQRSIDGNVIASANVIDVSTQQLGSRGISELFLTNINGEFKSNTSATNNYQGIEFTDNDGVGRIEPSIYPTLSKIPGSPAPEASTLFHKSKKNSLVILCLTKAAELLALPLCGFCSHQAPDLQAIISLSSAENKEISAALRIPPARTASAICHTIS